MESWKVWSAGLLIFLLGWFVILHLSSLFGQNAIPVAVVFGGAGLILMVLGWTEADL